MPLSSSSGLLLTLLTSITVGAAVDDFRTAVHYYKTKHYAQAAVIFEDLVNHQYKNSANAHYYLANCLLKTNRKSEAFQEYAKVIHLSPNSLVGNYSKRVLNFNHSFVKDDSRRLPAVVQAKPDSPSQADLIAKEIKSKIPPPPELVTNYRVGITLAQFRQTGNKNHFQAYDHYKIAENAFLKAKENLNKVRLMVSGRTPSQRKSGETEEELKKRRKLYEDAIKKILAPYEDNVMETEKWMLEKEAIWNGRLTIQ